MTDIFSVSNTPTALLVMDYQNDMVSSTGEKKEALLERAANVLQAARDAHFTIIYVVVRFREGYPEVNPRNRGFSAIRGMGHLQEGQPGTEIHPRVAPLPGESVVTKRRVGAFSTTDLETLLKARDITRLIMMGIATSGVVLSTVRWAADMDYELVVVEDCCADRDEEVHRVLTQKVFPRQASVISSQELLEAFQSRM
ncbi:cysteine hydrolase family protein [Ktedonospora formicarum]|uniref:Cysteine hydrolase n=1 Tax=Ktedonospora formicarum TaxID=2778364 RepID=A0A8J3MSB6_9CHLR|nr:isochorismatase family cysteine hydrolase [Ktedonospora formicarum]GHO46917.1 cysteine hydrolase [Ktedonospora formicarum]